MAQKYHINKYPTLKLFRAGQLAKREYRGSRSVEALQQFIEQQLEQKIHEFSTIDELNSKINVIFFVLFGFRLKFQKNFALIER